MHFTTLASAAALFQLSIAGYVLEDDYMTDFYGSFDFFTAADPTNGFVKYVDNPTARSMGLINASTTVPVQWGVDTTNKDSEGRASIRLTSKKSYNTGLVVIDVQHMPFGCGTWPAFWMVGPDWPNGGEIDILEGVNEQDTNQITLHTSSGCSIGADTGAFNGNVGTSNCDVNAEGQSQNAGCSIQQNSQQSYGTGLNNNGGGVYATEWTPDAISVYFFPRGSIPDGALGDSPDPSGWGKPAAKFANDGCDIEKYFKDQQIVFDTTFCGDWAGNVWSSGSCASKAATCTDYVRDNPEAFTDAFWTINALKVYTNNGDAAPPSLETTSQPSETPVPSSARSEAPVPTSEPEPTPTVAPSSEEPVPTSTNFESPPIVDPSAIPSDPTPVPSFTRTRHHGGHRPTVQSEVLVPSGGAGSGQMGSGGFDWPQGTGGPSEPVPSETAPPFPIGNSTVPLPTGTGTGAIGGPSGFTSILIGTGIGAQPTDLEAMPSFGDATPTPTAEDVPTVTEIDTVVAIETVVQTVVVTVDAPAETPVAGSRKARHARMHRKRMVMHNGRH